MDEKIRNLEETVLAQQHEISDLKKELGTLKAESQSLLLKFDELMVSMKFLVTKYNDMEKRVAGEQKDVPEPRSDDPMTVHPNGSKPDKSTATAEVDRLADIFAALPVDQLASHMWETAMTNIGELNGPATVDLMESQFENFARFITSVSSKQNFFDTVKKTCRERGFSKGVTRKMLKQISDIKVNDD